MLSVCKRALIAGGATLHKARIRHAIIGILVLNLFLELSPTTLEQVFSHGEWNEVVTLMLSSGLLLYALVRYGYEKKMEEGHA